VAWIVLSARSVRSVVAAMLVLALAAPAFADDDADTTSTATKDKDEPPFTKAQLDWLKAHLEEKQRYKLAFDVFIKGLYQNDQSNGSVFLGNPHPEGDNYSGNNGIAGVLGIHIDGRVNESITAGARLETRFGAQFADFYENGDLAVDSNGRPSGVNATGESLGMNHAAYAQLRGLYIQWDKPIPIPTLTTMRAGSSDLSMWNSWTVGKIRFIDRDNAKGFFFLGAAPGVGLDYNVARIALPKLYASAGFNTGIADPLIENPFWARDAIYVGKVHFTAPKLDTTFITSYLLDEEADLNDPDALGSTNLIDKKDGVVNTIPRYQNWNSTVETIYRPTPHARAELLVGASRSDPTRKLVYNTIDNDQGLSPIPLKTVNGYALRARFEADDVAHTGLTVRAEAFDIGSDWVATMGARREDDVLWTEGFLDGQVPTLNIANEFMDFTEPFYETIIGWRGATLKPRLKLGRLELEAEGTFIGYNTNAQHRCTSKFVPGCEITGGQYPDFLFPDGMTDTDFFTFANTNDRGRDPRAAYRTNQDRVTYLGFARARLAFGKKDRGFVELKGKYIRDKDLRDVTIVGADDYLGHLYTGVASVGWQVSSRASIGGGVKIDYWDEKHRSGAVVAGVARYPDYLTEKSKVWVEARYQFVGGTFFSYRLEVLNKDVNTTDDALDFHYVNVIRSIAMLYAGF
jgi:hypothetical protein